MRETELWSRFEAMLGRGYIGSWVSTVALQKLKSRTVDEALAVGVPCRETWRAVWVALGLSETVR